MYLITFSLLITFYIYITEGNYIYICIYLFIYLHVSCCKTSDYIVIINNFIVTNYLRLSFHLNKSALMFNFMTSVLLHHMKIPAFGYLTSCSLKDVQNYRIKFCLLQGKTVGWAWNKFVLI